MLIYYYEIPDDSGEFMFDIVVMAPSLFRADELAHKEALRAGYRPDQVVFKNSRTIPKDSEVIYTTDGEVDKGPQFIRLRMGDGSHTLIEKMTPGTFFASRAKEGFWSDVIFYMKAIEYSREGDLVCLCLRVKSPRESDNESVGRRHHTSPYQQTLSTKIVYVTEDDMYEGRHGRELIMKKE